MATRGNFAAFALTLSAGMALGQVHQVAQTPDDGDVQGFRPTDASLGVNDHAVLVTTNMRVSLFEKSTGDLKDTENQGAGFLMVKTATTYGQLFDPRSNYDPINDRLWYFYCDNNAADPSTQPMGDIARVHVAISKDGATLDSLGTSDWHLYTCDPAPSGAAGTAFDLTDLSIQRYQDEPDHLPLTTLPDFPSMGFDERAMIFTPYSGDPASALFQAIVIFPFTHDGGTKSSSTASARTRAT